jgi:hypothetical protein
MSARARNARGHDRHLAGRVAASGAARGLFVAQEGRDRVGSRQDMDGTVSSWRSADMVTARGQGHGGRTGSRKSRQGHERAGRVAKPCPRAGSRKIGRGHGRSGRVTRPCPATPPRGHASYGHSAGSRRRRGPRVALNACAVHVLGLGRVGGRTIGARGRSRSPGRGSPKACLWRNTASPLQPARPDVSQGGDGRRPARFPRGAPSSDTPRQPRSSEAKAGAGPRQEPAVQVCPRPHGRWK